MSRLQAWVDPRLYVAPSSIQGLGLHTRKPFKPGEVVVRWGGVLIPRSAFQSDRYRLQSTTCYDDDHFLTLPLSESPDLGDYINHSCDPNTWMLDRVTVIARYPIAAGDEITTDFALWSDEDYVYTTRCHCGSPLCRGTITGKDWQIPALLKRYRGHFVPFINAKIERLKQP